MLWLMCRTYHLSSLSHSCGHERSTVPMFNEVSSEITPTDNENGSGKKLTNRHKRKIAYR